VLFKGLVGNEEERNRSRKTTVLTTVLFARASACVGVFLKNFAGSLNPDACYTSDGSARCRLQIKMPRYVFC
jgi:hypothetical protein